MLSKTVLKIHDLNMESRTYGSIVHISFRVLDSEVIGLLGLDGSGIELLCRVICGNPGVFDGARGSVWLNGKEVRHARELRSCVRYICMQESVLDNWTVAEYLGMRHAHSFIGVRQKQVMKEYAEEKLRNLGCKVEVSRLMSEISELDRRTARIIHEAEKGAQLLIIEDECIGMKTTEIREYASVIHKISESGVSVLFRSRSLQISESVCREFLVFRRGRLVKRWKQNEKADLELLPQYLLGDTIAAEIRTLLRTQRNIRARKDIIYQVQDLWLSGKKSWFRLYEGEVSAYVVENNLYCRELFEHLSGRKISPSTRYYLGFRELHCRNVKGFIHFRIVSTILGNEDDYLFRNMSVEDNILLPSLQKFSTLRYFQQSENLHRASRELVWGDPNKRGNEQIRSADQSSRIRIEMERWFMFRPKVLILFEPFSSCDAYGASLISSYIKRFANAGTSVILVKSNEEYLLEIADHIHKIEA